MTEKPGAQDVREACAHERLSFQSGDYYLHCDQCDRRWIMYGHGVHPEYHIDAKGTRIGGNPDACCHAVGDPVRAALAQSDAQPVVQSQGGGGEAVADPRPANCRFRLQDEGKAYPRSACTACGKTITTGLGTHCIVSSNPPASPDGAVREALEEKIKFWQGEAGRWADAFAVERRQREQGTSPPQPGLIEAAEDFAINEDVADDAYKVWAGNHTKDPSGVDAFKAGISYGIRHVVRTRAASNRSA